MPIDVPSHKPEHTGNAVVDRIQNTILGIVAYLRSLIWMRRRAHVELLDDQTISITVYPAGYVTLLTANIVTAEAKSILVVSFTASGIKTTAAGTVFFRVLIDDVVLRGAYVTVTTPGFSFTSAILCAGAVVAGGHVVKLQWMTNVTGAQILSKTTVEEHASMHVWEEAYP